MGYALLPKTMVSRRMWIGRLRAGLRFAGMLFICSSAILAVSELLNHWGTHYGLFYWLAEHPGAVLLNLVFVLSGVVFLTFLCNGLDAGCQLATLVFLIPAVASFFKYRWLHEPLVPTDVGLARQMLPLLPRMFPFVPAVAIAGGVITILFLLGFTIRRTTQLRFSWGIRAVVCGSSIAIPAMAMASPPVRMSLASSASMGSGSRVALGQSYQQYGFTLSFATAIGPWGPVMPEGYSNLTVQAVADRLAADGHKTIQSVVPADVVVVLSESFWDPTQLAGIHFSQDPAPFYHALRKQSPQSDFVAPGFGGGTANTEFELLTGLSMRFVPEGAVPYMQFIRDPIPSIPRLFLTQGYATVAIHPFERTFWYRNMVYPRLGFERFDAVDTFSRRDVKGPYVSDFSLMQRVISELSAAKRPTFLLAITMENHGPYVNKWATGHSIKVTGKLTPSQADILESYCEGVRDADQALGMLVDYLQHRDRPAVLVFFGDHLPSFGPDYSILKETGFISDGLSAQDQLKIHRPPALVWTNFPCNLPDRGSVTSPQMIWPDILPALGMEHPFFTTFLGKVRQQTPALSHAVTVDHNGQPMLAMPEGNAILKDYQMIQYDTLFGRHFGRGTMFPEMLSSDVEVPADQARQLH